MLRVVRKVVGNDRDNSRAALNRSNVCHVYLSVSSVSSDGRIFADRSKSQHVHLDAANHPFTQARICGSAATDIQRECIRRLINTGLSGVLLALASLKPHLGSDNFLFGQRSH